MKLKGKAIHCAAGGLLLAFAAGTPAQTPETKLLPWDCWVGAEIPVTIRCIQDRDNLLRAEEFTSDLEALLLDHIHSRIHSGDTSELDRFVRDNTRVFREGSIWTIQIHNFPYESSWVEERPQRLVRAVLCPPGYDCPVLLRKP
ncbi:MAG: hypothetical protein HYU77_12475 [Betaproteobacteria bacterium]|nr:hypothetical protein [Betaproteobacteria bacterium]